MTRVKDYFGEKFLNESENIKLDFIHAQLENGYETNANATNWQLTINVGQTDPNGYVDALIIDVSMAQYPSFFDDYEGDIEFKTVQRPEGWGQEKVKHFVFKYRSEIDKAIEEFEKEVD